MNIKNIYVKELEPVGKYRVRLVDGEYIRKNINENFVEYDSHSHLPFIPVNEFWIDKDSNPNERHFFVDHLINESWIMAEGNNYEEAEKKADSLEKKERARFLHIENKNKLPTTKKEIIKKIHKKILREHGDSLKVWLVDGKAVRDYLFVEYADGGHDRVYSFIPKGEVWIEEVLPSREARFILLHELHERFLMGQGKNYVNAHRGATIVEDYYRDHPAEIDERIQKEIEKNI